MAQSDTQPVQITPEDFSQLLGGDPFSKLTLLAQEEIKVIAMQRMLAQAHDEKLALQKELETNGVRSEDELAKARA